MNSDQRAADTDSRPPTVYDQKYVDFVDNVLREVADEFKKEKKFWTKCMFSFKHSTFLNMDKKRERKNDTKSDQVSDQNLLKLYKLFGGVFERALDLYEQKRVTQISTCDKIIAEPYQYINEVSWLMQIKGHSGALYTLFPEVNYCSCAAFRFHINTMNSNTDDYILVAKMGLANLRIAIELLKTVNFKEIAICFGNENGLKVTVEDAKCMQASAYIPRTIFDEFKLKEDVMFSLSLSILVECLSMFRSTSEEDSIAVQIFYKGIGYPLSIIIVEDGVITDCSLQTLEVDTILDFHLDTGDVVNKIVLQTELLKDAMTELDSTSELVELCLSPEEPFFRISTEGLGGICHIGFPHDSDLIDTFQCTSTVTSNFKLTHIKQAMKALLCADKVSLRTNNTGLLCFQYMIKTESGHVCYVEYYISPLIDMFD